MPLPVMLKWLLATGGGFKLAVLLGRGRAAPGPGGPAEGRPGMGALAVASSSAIVADPELAHADDLAATRWVA